MKERQHNRQISKDLNRPFGDKEIQIANKHMKWHSTLPVIGKMQVKTKQILPSTIRLAKVWQSQILAKSRTKKFSYPANGGVNW